VSPRTPFPPASLVDVLREASVTTVWSFFSSAGFLPKYEAMDWVMIPLRQEALEILLNPIFERSREVARSESKDLVAEVVSQNTTCQKVKTTHKVEHLAQGRDVDNIFGGTMSGKWSCPPIHALKDLFAGQKTRRGIGDRRRWRRGKQRRGINATLFMW